MSICLSVVEQDWGRQHSSSMCCSPSCFQNAGVLTVDSLSLSESTETIVDSTDDMACRLHIGRSILASGHGKGIKRSFEMLGIKYFLYLQGLQLPLQDSQSCRFERCARTGNSFTSLRQRTLCLMMGCQRCWRSSEGKEALPACARICQMASPPSLKSTRSSTTSKTPLGTGLPAFLDIFCETTHEACELYHQAYMCCLQWKRVQMPCIVPCLLTARYE